ncbi:MAG: DUF2281 domain-containing protein, partial [Patescibacteria group bacterium]
METILTKDFIRIFDILPDDKKKEVYDFTEFLRTKMVTIKIGRENAVEKVFGSTKGSSLTTDLFTKIKAEEKEL